MKKIVDTKTLANVLGVKIDRIKAWKIPVWGKRKGFGGDTYDLYGSIDWLRVNTKGRRFLLLPTPEEVEKTLLLTRSRFRWSNERIEDEKLSIVDEVPDKFVAHGKLLDKTQ